MMRSRVLRTALAAAVMLAAACAISPEEELGACGPGGECPAGASCLVNFCVADREVAEGQTCSHSEQCEERLVCSTSPFVCRRPCSMAYVTDSACVLAEYCRPGFDTDGAFQPVCVPGDCAISPTCMPDELCVPVGVNAGTCLRSCDYVIDTVGAFVSNCGGSTGMAQTCQPVGVPGAEVLVCLDLGDRVARTEGASCDLGDTLCEFGLGCWRGACHRYCDAATMAPCGGGSTCCTITTDEGSFGLCMAGCP